jgi:hypothetical protein
MRLCDPNARTDPGRQIVRVVAHRNPREHVATPGCERSVLGQPPAELSARFGDLVIRTRLKLSAHTRSLLATGGTRLVLRAASLRTRHSDGALAPSPAREVVTIPLAPRTARAIDLAVGERCDGPIFVGADGSRIDRHAAGRIVRRIARRAGIAKRVGPTPCVRRSSPLRSTPGFRCATSRKPPATPIPTPPCATTRPGPTGAG